MPEETEKQASLPEIDKESQKLMEEAGTLYNEFVQGRMRAGNLPGEPDRSPRGKALERALKVLEKYPSDPRPLMLLGIIHHGMGEFPQAEDYLKRAEAAGASNLDLHRLLSEVFLERGAYDEVKKHVGYIRQHDKTRPEIYEIESELYKRKGNWEERLRALEDLIEIRPSDDLPAIDLITTLLKMKKNKAALEELLEFDEIIPDSPEIKFLLGNVHADMKKLSEAKGYYQRVLDLNPDHNVARFELANVLDESGKPRESLRLYQEYIDVIKDDPDAYCNAAGVAEGLGDIELAVKYYLEYLKYTEDEKEFDEVLSWVNNNAPGNIDPGELQVRLAMANLEQDDPESALMELKAASDVGIVDRRTLFLMGKAHAALNGYKAAQEFYKKAMEHDDFADELGFSDDDILIAAGEASFELGNLSDAEETAKELMSIETNVDGHVLMGDIYLEKKDYDNAYKEFVHALRIDLFCFDALFGLGELFEARGDFYNAAKSFRLCLEIEPDNEDALFSLGKDYIQLGYKEWGDMYLKKYLELCPKGDCAGEARKIMGK